MELNKEYPKPLKQDKEAPETLEIQIIDKKTGKILFTENIKQKHFSSGSIGYNCSGKMS